MSFQDKKEDALVEKEAELPLDEVADVEEEEATSEEVAFEEAFGETQALNKEAKERQRRRLLQGFFIF